MACFQLLALGLCYTPPERLNTLISHQGSHPAFRLLWLSALFLIPSLRDASDACRAQGIASLWTTCCQSPWHRTLAGSSGCPCLHWPFSVVVWRELPTHSWFLKQGNSCSVFTRNILSGGTLIRTSDRHEKKILQHKRTVFCTSSRKAEEIAPFTKQSTEDLNHLSSFPTAIALPEGTFCYMQQLGGEGADHEAIWDSKPCMMCANPCQYF